MVSKIVIIVLLLLLIIVFFTLILPLIISFVIKKILKQKLKLLKILSKNDKYLTREKREKIFALYDQVVKKEKQKFFNNYDFTFNNNKKFCSDYLYKIKNLLKKKFIFIHIKKFIEIEIKIFKHKKNMESFYSIANKISLYNDSIKQDFYDLRYIYSKMEIKSKIIYALNNESLIKSLSNINDDINTSFREGRTALDKSNYLTTKSKLLFICKQLENYLKFIQISSIANYMIECGINDYAAIYENSAINYKPPNVIQNDKKKLLFFKTEITNSISSSNFLKIRNQLQNFFELYNEYLSNIKYNDYIKSLCDNYFIYVDATYKFVSQRYEFMITFTKKIPLFLQVFFEKNKLFQALQNKYSKFENVYSKLLVIKTKNKKILSDYFLIFNLVKLFFSNQDFILKCIKKINIEVKAIHHKFNTIKPIIQSVQNLILNIVNLFEKYKINKKKSFFISDILEWLVKINYIVNKYNKNEFTILELFDYYNELVKIYRKLIEKKVKLNCIIKKIKIAEKMLLNENLKHSYYEDPEGFEKLKYKINLFSNHKYFILFDELNI